MLDEMLEGARRIKRIVEDLKDFARRDDTAVKEPLDLNAVVQAAVRLVEPTLRKATNRFKARYADGLPKVLGNAQRIEQVVINLILNACQALPDPDRGVFLETRYDPETGACELRVRDEGVGIAAEHLPRLTDPFFTTKRESGGTGLGLSVSAGIVKEHGGALSFDSHTRRRDHRHPDAAGRRGETSMMNTSRYPGFGVLLVDDEPAWLRSLSLTLERSAGITNILTCQDSREVMELLDSRRSGSCSWT